TVTSEMPSNSSGTPEVKRSVPVTESMPTTAIERPSTSDARPLSTESETTDDVATNAKSASAKYSAGPKTADSAASAGARNTTSSDETMPPVNAPIAAVASACGARPDRAILWPSNVEAIADPWPGV